MNTVALRKFDPVTARFDFSIGQPAIADPQLLHWAKLLDQLAYRLHPVGNRAKTAYLAIRFGYRCGNRFGMDIHAQKS